jgi:Flp pilus assembly protein TadG
MRATSESRRGAVTVEFALVAPLTFLLVLGLLVGGMGVFRYCEVATLAREASRWASVHGSGYQKDTGNAAATAQDVYNNVIATEATSLAANKLTYSVTWNTTNDPGSNTVRVTVSYQWLPEVFLGGITLTSTSEAVMSN